METTPQLRLLAWEITRQCNLSCIHCRAGSEAGPYPNELATEECLKLLDDITSFSKPIIILTGGEPLLRQDVFEISRYGTEKGLRVVMATNGTLITEAIANKMVESGIKRVSISIDGSSSASHDKFRQVDGAFDGAVRGIRHIKDVGLDFQINTTVTLDNINELSQIQDLAVDLGAVAHHIFLLVPTGRGRDLFDRVLPAMEYERVLNWLYENQKRVPIHIKVTCAPHYYRILKQRNKQGSKEPTFHPQGLDAVTRGCLGGTGFCFISHIGDVHPCGYLELYCGNIRTQPLEAIWQNSEIFRNLRNPNRFKGKCGRCEYRHVCGGCRARAYAVTGDYMSEEPFCIYQPGDMEQMDHLDRAILNEIQSKFPIASRPYKILGERLNISEEEVLRRVRILKDKGIIRRLGANFASHKLGFTSTLCAAEVPEEKVGDFVKVVNAYSGVTHNYKRKHPYNIWFTIIAQSEQEIETIVNDISKKTGIEIYNLPAIQVFKVCVNFEM